MLSCYDAELGYDRRTDTFCARYLKKLPHLEKKTWALLEELVDSGVSPLKWVIYCRYAPHGQRMIVVEEGVQWDRIRAPPVDASPQDLYVSECLSDLRPGDHVEIQWRRSKEFPYGRLFTPLIQIIYYVCIDLIIVSYYF